MPDRDLDLVLLGATGFTGGLVAEDLARQLAGTGHRWAIAGRDGNRLRDVEEGLAGIDAGGAPDELVTVDVHDAGGLRSLTERTRVLATTVGPFAALGEPVVAACVASGTDYVDITGEPSFVARIVHRYDEGARDAGVRIVNCCGFESVPHDLGAQLAVERLPRDVPIRLRGYVSAGGRPSGGTVRSAVEVLGDTDADRGTRPDPGPGRRVGGLPRRIEKVDAIGGWAVPLPTIDPRIVLRSAAALERYGPDFRYGHFARVPSFMVAAAMVGAVGAVTAVARVRPGRALLSRLAPVAGDGPDQQQRAEGWFRVVMIGEGGDQRTRVEVRGGDPGSGETSRMLAEAARCLLDDRAALPDAAGILTPAVAFGHVLRDRLQRRGVTFTVADG